MKRTIVVIAHNIRSLHNVGSVFRTADALGVAKIFLTGYTGRPPRKEITKVALGAEATVLWEYRKKPVDVIKQLKAEGYTVIALEQTKMSVPLSTLTVPDRVAIIVGNEVKGISPSLWHQADAVVEIPMLGKKESLNVSVAFGIALYAIRFQS